MNRETKFRGKRADNGEWVYGDLIRYSENEYKILESFYRQWDILEGGYDVIPESVGEYTGLKDKEIWEGDVAKYYNRIGVIVYDNKRAAYCLYTKPDNVYVQLFNTVAREIEVIGKIYDNPELLNQLS